MTKMYPDFERYDEYYEDVKGKIAKPDKKVRKWSQYVPKLGKVVEKPVGKRVDRPRPVVDTKTGLCPCGCSRPVPNRCYWATEECGERAKKHGMFMPMNGEWRQATRIARKMNLLKKGKK